MTMITHSLRIHFLTRAGGLLGICLLANCTPGSAVPPQASRPSSAEPEYIPPSPQRTGDSAKGYEYLVTGNYIRSGPPLALYQAMVGNTSQNRLHRQGINKNIGHDFTAVKAPNGETVVGPNCLQCHSQVFDDTLVVGLGNAAADFTAANMPDPQMMSMLEQTLRAQSPAQYEAAKPFLQSFKAIGGRIATPVRGVNPAVHLTAILAAHRDPRTLRWSDTALMPIPDTWVPTDVPAWWLLKKKHAMFHTALGRGDFGRFLMVSNLLTATDTIEANEVDTHFNDVLAYITSLQPPRYPRPINTQQASLGRAIYVESCSGCHGSRNLDGKDYPNLLIPASIIKTDSLAFASYYTDNAPYIEWGSKSWFAQGDHPARLVRSRGYVAPPLDGVWITAPYFHNGSVPTLEGVLNSKARPTYWSRDFDNPAYDYTAVGWQYTSYNTPDGNTVYNTTLPGYGNQGHEFGDHLTKEERAAVIEYLKTLGAP